MVSSCNTLFLVQYCFLFATRCYLSNVPAPASRVSQVPVSMYSLSPFFYLSLTLFFWALTPLHNAKCPLRSSQVLMSEIMKSRSCRPACVCVLSVARACCQVASTSPAPFQIATLPFLPSLGLCSSTWHNFWEPPEDWMGRENAGKDDVGQNLQVVHQSSSPWATDCPPLYILGRQLRRWQFYFATWKMAIFRVLTMLSLFCFPRP